MPVKSTGLNELVLFLPDIRELLKENNYAQVKECLRQMHPSDIAGSWQYLSETEKLIIFRFLEQARMVQVFEYLSFNDQKFLLDHLKSEEISTVLEGMSSDDEADLFEDLPKKVVRKLFSLMRQEKARQLQHLLSYPPDSCGGIMSTDFVALTKGMTAREALLKVQQATRHRPDERVHVAYVTDEEGRLLGGVSITDLVSALPDDKIDGIMSLARLIKLNVNWDREEAAKIFAKYDLVAAPITDDNGKLVGVVTIDDVVDVIQEEATKDIYGLGKISSPESAADVSYIKTSVFALIRKRVLWLAILMFIAAFITGPLLKGYAGILQSIIILAVFIPMIMDSGGNAGQQSLAMMVRGLATGDITPYLWSKVLRKELVSGIGLGLIMAVLAGISAAILGGMDIQLSITVGVSLFVVICISTVVGAMLPIFFKRLGLDPAIAASPFITTLVDATCVIVYFSMAKWLLL